MLYRFGQVAYAVSLVVAAVWTVLCLIAILTTRGADLGSVAFGLVLGLVIAVLILGAGRATRFILSGY